MELKKIERDLAAATKSKFKYIVGHNKAEVQPEQFVEEEKVVKNINNRIIIPCQRITQVQDGVKALHAQADKFEEYLSSIKGSKDNRRARARYAHRSKPKHMSTAEPMPVKGS